MADQPFQDLFTPEGTSDFEKGISTGPFRLAQRPPGQPTGTLKWRLNDAAALIGDGAGDSAVLRASEWIAGTLEGQQLIAEIKKRVKTRPPMTVEVFESASTLAARQSELSGVARIDGEGLHGFSRPIANGTLSSSADFEEVEPLLHFVVGIKTISRRSEADRTVERDFVQFSEPVRTLSTAETLFHEFLHVSTIAATAREQLRIQPPFLETEATGHGGDTSFTIDPFTLKLEMRGEIEAAFGARLERFMNEVIVTFRVRTLVEEERRKFRALSRP